MDENIISASKKKKKVQRTDTKNKAKKTKNDNCTRSNREKCNIATEILKMIKFYLFRILGAPKLFSPAVHNFFNRFYGFI